MVISNLADAKLYNNIQYFICIKPFQVALVDKTRW